MVEEKQKVIRAQKDVPPPETRPRVPTLNGLDKNDGDEGIDRVVETGPFDPGAQYLTERFLAAFDETKVRYELSERDMEKVFDHPGKAKVIISEARRFFSKRMYRPDETGTFVKASVIAQVLGVSQSCVEKYVGWGSERPLGRPRNDAARRPAEVAR